MATDLDDERAVLEVIEFSESEDEDFEYRVVEVRCVSSSFLYDSLCSRWSHNGTPIMKSLSRRTNFP